MYNASSGVTDEEKYDILHLPIRVKKKKNTAQYLKKNMVFSTTANALWRRAKENLLLPKTSIHPSAGVRENRGNIDGTRVELDYEQNKTDRPPK